MIAPVLSALEEASANIPLNLILSQARKTFSDLEGWTISEETLKLPEHQVEAGIEQRARELSRLLLQAHVTQRGTGNVGPVIEVTPKEGESREHEAQKPRPCTIVSIFGDIKAQRTPYMAAGQESIYPLDAQLQLPQRSFSYELQRRVIEEVIRGPFDEAKESIEKTTGNVLSKRSLEEIAKDGAEDFDRFYEQRQALPPEETSEILVGSVDGKGIPMVKPPGETKPKVRLKKGEKPNKKKMGTVATVYTTQERVRTPQEVADSLFKKEPPKEEPRIEPENKRVWASIEKSKEEVIREMAEEIEKRDPKNEKKKVVVTDGERALQNLVMAVLTGILLILDFLHVLEKLWKVANILHKEGSEEAAAWVYRHALMILEGKVSQVIKGMRQSATKRGIKGKKLETIEQVAKYFYRNRSRMRYNEYLAQGLPIASGAVEGACKNLVKDRMERSGMRWTKEGAEAILKLRAIKLSRDWEAYWNFHIEQDQQRLYGSCEWKAVA